MSPVFTVFALDGFGEQRIMYAFECFSHHVV
jgi:hypothetical protein